MAEVVRQKQEKEQGTFFEHFPSETSVVHI